MLSAAVHLAVSASKSGQTMLAKELLLEHGLKESILIKFEDEWYNVDVIEAAQCAVAAVSGYTDNGNNQWGFNKACLESIALEAVLARFSYYTPVYTRRRSMDTYTSSR